MPLPLAIVAPVAFPLLGLPGNRQRTYRIAILSEGFLPQEMSGFRDVAEQVLDKFRRTQPFRRLLQRILIVGVQCTSLASSRLLRRTGPGPRRHFNVTPFDVGFVGSATAMEGDVDAVPNVLKSISGLPPIDAALVIMNSDEIGGTSPGNISWLTTRGSFEDTFLHELGHAGFGLGDEYEDPGLAALTYADPEPVHANLTIEQDPDRIPWRSLFKPATVVIPSTVPPLTCRRDHPRKRDVPSGAVGLFEGGGLHSCEIFRPSETCKMRENADNFCVVCEQTIFERLAGGILDARQPLVFPTEEWTHVAALPVSPVPPTTFDLVAYNSRTGRLAAYETKDFFSFTPAATVRVADAIGQGFLSMTTFAAANDRFVYLDNFFNDQRQILKIAQSTLNSRVIGFDPQFNPPAVLPALRGFSHVVPVQLPGAAALLHYDRISGALELEFFDLITRKPQTIASTAANTLQPWHPLLSSLTTVTLNGLPHVIGVDASARKVFIARAGLRAAPPPTLLTDPQPPRIFLTDTFASEAGFLMPMETHALGFLHHSHPKLLTYSTQDGGARVYEIRLDGSGMDFVYGWPLTPGASSLFDVGLPAFGLIGDGDSPANHLWFYNAGLRRFTVFPLR
jgi:hypothetical protein